jgi:hypothetical protein
VQADGVADPLLDELLAAVAAAAAGDLDPLGVPGLAQPLLDVRQLALVADADDELRPDLLGQLHRGLADLLGVLAPLVLGPVLVVQVGPAAAGDLPQVERAALHRHLLRHLARVVRGDDVGARAVGVHDDVGDLGGDVGDEREQVGQRGDVDDVGRRPGGHRLGEHDARLGQARDDQAGLALVVAALRLGDGLADRRRHALLLEALQDGLPGQVVAVRRLLDRALGTDVHGDEGAGCGEDVGQVAQLHGDLRVGGSRGVAGSWAVVRPGLGRPTPARAGPTPASCRMGHSPGGPVTGSTGPGVRCWQSHQEPPGQRSCSDSRHASQITRAAYAAASRRRSCSRCTRAGRGDGPRRARTA